jgi:hypothetical protein
LPKRSIYLRHLLLRGISTNNTRQALARFEIR